MNLINEPTWIELSPNSVMALLTTGDVKSLVIGEIDDCRSLTGVPVAACQIHRYVCRAAMTSSSLGVKSASL